MKHLDDWFKVDDEEFVARRQKNKELSSLFTEEALVVLWKFLC
jgi:hypothetical protein